MWATGLTPVWQPSPQQLEVAYPSPVDLGQAADQPGEPSGVGSAGS